MHLFHLHLPAPASTYDAPFSPASKMHLHLHLRCTLFTCMKFWVAARATALLLFLSSPSFSSLSSLWHNFNEVVVNGHNIDTILLLPVTFFHSSCQSPQKIASVPKWMFLVAENGVGGHCQGLKFSSKQVKLYLWSFLWSFFLTSESFSYMWSFCLTSEALSVKLTYLESTASVPPSRLSWRYWPENWEMLSQDVFTRCFHKIFSHDVFTRCFHKMFSQDATRRCHKMKQNVTRCNKMLSQDGSWKRCLV